MRTTIIGGGIAVAGRLRGPIGRRLIAGALLILSHVAIAGTLATDIDLEINGLSFIKSDPGGAISGSLDSGGRTGFGFASIGILGSRVTDTVAGNDSAQVDFVDTLSFLGGGTIELSQNLSGVLKPNGAGTAKVLAALSLSGTGFLGISTEYQKQVSTIAGNFEVDQGPLIVPVSDGESLTLFGTLTTVVIGTANADYGSTDKVFITPMTPGLQVISAGGHDYSPTAPAPGPPSTPEAESLSLVGAGLAALCVEATEQAE